MSADYLNFIVSLPSPEARRHFGILSGAQHRADLIGPEEETLARVRGDEAFDVAVVAKSYGGSPPAPPEYGRAWVNVDPSEWMELLERESPRFRCVLSIGEPTLCAIDRVIALPRGVAFLDGQAIARFRPKRRARVRRAWSRMVAELSGPKGVASTLAPYLSRGVEFAAVVPIMVASALAWGDEHAGDVVMFVTRT